MKATVIVPVLLIAAAIGLFIFSSKDMTTYSTFAQAVSSGGTVKVAGELSKDKEMVYDPLTDPNYFSFYVTDRSGEEKKVVMYQAKPQDFEMSEGIVLTGRMEGDEFIASDVLLKCPSKYKDEEVLLREENS